MLLLLEISQVISAIVVLLLVLMHSAKGDGIGSIGGQVNMFSSSSHLEKGLNTITWVFGVIFLLSSALLGWRLFN